MKLTPNFFDESSTAPLLIGLAISLYFFTFSFLGYDLSYFLGDLADGRLNLYFLEHAHRFFTGDVTSYWSAPFMFPQEDIITYSDNLLGTAPLYSLFRALGCDTFLAYQWWYITLSSLNYLAAFLLLRWVSKNSYAAVLGAIVFAFSLSMQSQIVHAQTYPRFAIPLAILFALKFGDSLHPKHFFWTIFFVVYQIWCGIYLGFMLMVPVGILLGIIMLREKKSWLSLYQRKHWLRNMALALVTNTLLLAPVIIPYMGRNIPPSAERYQEIFNTIPSLGSYLFSPPKSLLWNALYETEMKTTTNYWDHHLFTGAIATLCMMAAFILLIIRLKKTKYRLKELSPTYTLILVGIITFFLFLRIGNVSLYHAIFFLPGFSAMRSVSRIINVEILFFAMATTYIFSLIMDKIQRHHFLIFLLVIPLLLADNYYELESKWGYRTKVKEAENRLTNLESLLKSVPENTIISYEPQQKTSKVEFYLLDAMMVSQKLGLQSVNGYTATGPLGYKDYWKNLDAESRNYWLIFSDAKYDTLFVIESDTVLKKLPYHLLEEYKRSDFIGGKVQNTIGKILLDKEWMQKIEEKARMRGISVDSMVHLDAIWLLEHQ